MKNIKVELSPRTILWILCIGGILYLFCSIASGIKMETALFSTLVMFIVLAFMARVFDDNRIEEALARQKTERMRSANNIISKAEKEAKSAMWDLCDYYKVTFSSIKYYGCVSLKEIEEAAERWNKKHKTIRVGIYISEYSKESDIIRYGGLRFEKL